jgi:hypothetical protein
MKKKKSVRIRCQPKENEKKLQAHSAEYLGTYQAFSIHFPKSAAVLFLCKFVTKDVIENPCIQLS